MSHAQNEHSSFKSCPNCHHPIGKPVDRFCSHCGQKNTDGKASMHDIWHEFIHNTLHLDGKFFRLVGHLLIPGKLTVEYFRGRRKRYPHPTRFFLVLMVFLLFGLSKMLTGIKHDLEKTAESQRQMNTRYLIVQEMDSLFSGLPKTMQTAGNQLLLDTISAKILENGKAEIIEQIFSLDSSFVERTVSTTDDSTGKVTPLNIKNPDSIRAFARREAKKDLTKQGLDSSEFWSVKFSNADLAHFSPDELVEKYRVDGWLKKLMISRLIKAENDPAGALKAVLGNTTWMILALILSMAGVLKLLHFRQKRLYVEHFVLLMHFTSGMALLFGIGFFLRAWLHQKWPPQLVLGWSYIALFLAMRRYYGQSLIKTLLKYLSFLTVEFFVLIILVIISLLASVAFF